MHSMIYGARLSSIESLLTPGNDRSMQAAFSDVTAHAIDSVIDWSNIGNSTTRSVD